MLESALSIYFIAVIPIQLREVPQCPAVFNSVYEDHMGVAASTNKHSTPIVRTTGPKLT